MKQKPTPLQGLQSLYNGFIPPGEITMDNLDDIVVYYKKLSKKWGYEVVPPGSVFINVALKLWGNDEKEQAIKVLRTAIVYNPKDSFSLFYLGRLLSLQNNLSEGLVYLQLAFEAEKGKSVPNGLNLNLYKETIAKQKNQ